MSLSNWVYRLLIMTLITTTVKQIGKVTYFGRYGGGYRNKPSIFDDMEEDDIIMAFFPCTMFQENNDMFFRGVSGQMGNWDEETKLEYVLSRNKTRTMMYERLSEMAIIALRRNLKMIIENPYTQPHFLTQQWPIKPKWIDKDRRDRGDKFQKPTQYFFINCEPKHNFIWEPQEYVETEIINKVKGADRQIRRSEITPVYANRFIREFILEG